MARYRDISHFRAPYKNMYVAGFGEDTAMPTVPGTRQVPGGLVTYLDEVAAPLRTTLTYSGYVETGKDSGEVQPISADEVTKIGNSADLMAKWYPVSAMAKIEQWWKDDKIVFINLGILTGQKPIYITAIPRSDRASLVQLAGNPAVSSASPVFKDPTRPDWTVNEPAGVAKPAKAGIGALGIVAIVVAAGGVGYLIYQGTKRSRLRAR